MTYRNDNFLLGNEVFDVELFGFSGDFCPPFVAVLSLYFVDIFANNIQQHLFAGQYRFVALYLFGKVGIFFGELFHLQAC
ncbi:hypothetical protein ES703_65856 [subsurface metagenome]